MRFAFHNAWCFCSNCLFTNQIKLFLCFEKFYNIFLSVTAVWKKPPHIRRLSPMSAWSEKLLLPQKHEVLPRNSVKLHAFFTCPFHTASHDIPKCQGCASASILRVFSDLEWCDTCSYEGILSRTWLQFLWCLSPCKLKWSTAACLPFQHST